MSNNQWTTRNGRTAKRGLFVGGVWHCDCDTRLPADKFQVKNGGKNHGRWFYTCQKPQPKRCSFFLWSDDAKVREEAAVLGNSRSEPGRAQDLPLADGGRLRSELEAPRTPKTPKRQSKITEPITPVSKPRRLLSEQTGTRQDRSPTMDFEPDENDESFDWSSSVDEDLAEFADSLEAEHRAQEQVQEQDEDDDESPRKIAKTSEHASPSKRSHRDTSDITSTATWLLDDDLWGTSSTSTRPAATGLLSPRTTPAHLRRQLFPPSDDAKHLASQQPADLAEEPSSLALEALSILSPIRSSLSPGTERSLVALLNKHELRTHGIEKGRDIARVAVQAKEKKITELQQRVVVLEAERERSRTVIQHLKTDIATSPKKPRRPRTEEARRSEV